MGEKRVVPLVVYSNGERIVVGEAEVVITKSDVRIASTVVDPEKLPEGKKLDTSEASYSIGYINLEPPQVEEIAAIPPLKLPFNDEDD